MEAVKEMATNLRVKKLVKARVEVSSLLFMFSHYSVFILPYMTKPLSPFYGVQRTAPFGLLKLNIKHKHRVCSRLEASRNFSHAQSVC